MRGRSRSEALLALKIFTLDFRFGEQLARDYLHLLYFYRLIRTPDNIVNRDNLRELTVFFLLLALGVVGRWYQPLWNFTPLAAVTVLGGYYFRQKSVAMLLPLAILVVSNVTLPAYMWWQEQVAVFGMMLVPLLLGRAARGAEGWQQAKHFAFCGFVPATLFFLVTNFTVWAVNPVFPKTIAGLSTCYAAGIPFYRWMLAGDLFFLAVMVGCVAVARSVSPALVADESR